MTPALENATIVLTALDEMFNKGDTGAVDRWVAADYRQHNPTVADGPEPLRGLIAGMASGLGHEPIRVLVDGDLVAVHSIYHGFAPGPVVAFDIFRVAGGRLAEHWDALQPLVADPVGGRSQVDGPTAPDRTADTGASRAVVEGFARDVLVGADYSRLGDYLQPDYRQHNPEAEDGIAGFGAAAAGWAGEGKTLAYRTVHKVIADGDLVLTQSEGEFGVPVAYYDLFRVRDGHIVEHWDVITPVPAESANANGLF